MEASFYIKECFDGRKNVPVSNDYPKSNMPPCLIIDVMSLVRQIGTGGAGTFGSLAGIIYDFVISTANVTKNI